MIETLVDLHDFFGIGPKQNVDKQDVLISFDYLEERGGDAEALALLREAMPRAECSVVRVWNSIPPIPYWGSLWCYKERRDYLFFIQMRIKNEPMLLGVKWLVTKKAAQKIARYLNRHPDDPELEKTAMRRAVEGKLKRFPKKQK